MITNSDNPAFSHEMQSILDNHSKFEKRRRSTRSLPKFYNNVLTTTLRDRLTEALSEKEDDQVSVLEELALIREQASVSVGIFAESYEKWKSGEAEGTTELLKLRESAMIAGSLMYSQLEKVTRCAKTASDIRKNQKEFFSVSDLYDIVGQLTRVMFEVCGPEHIDIAENFEKRVESDVSFIQEKTRITPDQYVIEMDATIPYVED